MTSLDGINGQSIQTLLRGENDSKHSDEFQATLKQDGIHFVICLKQGNEIEGVVLNRVGHPQ